MSKWSTLVGFEVNNNDDENIGIKKTTMSLISTTRKRKKYIVQILKGSK